MLSFVMTVLLKLWTLRNCGQLHKNRLETLLWIGERSIHLDKELLEVNGFWGRENQFSSVIWSLVSYPWFSKPYTLAHGGEPAQAQRVIKRIKI